MIDGDLIVFEPLRVRLPRSQPVFDFFVGDDAALAGIHQKHLPRLQAALHLHLLWFNVEHTGLGGHDDVLVMRDHVPSGAQPVAVEDRSDNSPVGKRDGGWSVPRFHQARVVFVKCALVRLHVGIASPRFRYQHGHRVRKAAPRLQQKFHRVIEICGVAAIGRNDGIELLQVVAKQRRLQNRLARVHPVDVALERVDLAVVRDVAIGMRSLPTRKCVGGEALMHQAQRAGYVGIGKLLVEVRDLRGKQETFVNNGAARKRRDMERLRILDAGCRHLTLGALPHHIKLPLKSVLVSECAASDKYLLDVRLRTSRHAANSGRKARGIAPAQHCQALLAHNALQNSFALQSRMFLHRQKCHPHAISAGKSQFETQFAALAHKELVRDLEKNAGAVSGLGIASAGATVR